MSGFHVFKVYQYMYGTSHVLTLHEPESVSLESISLSMSDVEGVAGGL